MNKRPDLWMSIDETRAFLAKRKNPIEYIKYVRLEGDTFFFANASNGSSPNHETAVVSGNAISAAYIGISDSRVVVRGGSLTLSLGPAKDDEELIAKKLGLIAGDK